MDDLILSAAVGFAAQIVDGALGMAYGVTATTILLSLGVAPAVVSASVHTAEVATTGISGLSHWWFGNIQRELFRKLVIPGMIGGAAGAYLLATVPGEAIRPFVNLYLLAMGGVILLKALRRPQTGARRPRHIAALRLVGGFLDTAGGGGWEPVVASTLLGSGEVPRFAIGSVNAAEFFVTVTVTATFVAATIGLSLWAIIAGLIRGGALAAPFAAYITQRLPDRPLMIIVAMVVILLSARGLFPAILPW